MSASSIAARALSALSARPIPSISPARAASAYGMHVATQIAADLASHDWAVISGAAYGIDAAAHAGATLFADKASGARSTATAWS